MLEIRGHARGGQGMVTAFEMLAKIFSKLNHYQVQAFPAFGVERTGAPIQAFLRIANQPILNRSNIYHPHLIIVFDESLLDQVPVFEGLMPGGSVLLNSERPAADFFDRCPNIYTVAATRIALELKLGSKSLPIVNAAMIGALTRIFEADPSIVETVIRANVPAKPDANAEAARRAYAEVKGITAPNAYLFDRLQLAETPEFQKPDSSAFTEIPDPQGLSAPFWSEPLSKNKTGNWRMITPAYIDRLPPCNHNCPAGTDVRAFVRLAAEDQFAEAYDVISQHNPFPSICGRVCPHFCAQNCNREAFDGSLNIGAIERFIGDQAAKTKVKPVPLKYKERVAVIGSGPAGLTAALRLRQRGYPVTVFEAMAKAGGMMRAGIPKFRLPDEVLDREIARIGQQGVDIVMNQKVKIKDLAGGYAAVISALGSHQGIALGLGSDGEIREGLSFLNNFKLEGDTGGIQKGDHVAIIGGGNTAIDVARTALRLGASPFIYYRRTIKEMPAIAQEVKEAMVEGVVFKFLKAPTAISRKENGGLELTLINMELGPPDASGRSRPIPVEGSEHEVVVDHVIAALGQRFDDFAFGDKTIKPRQGAIDFEEEVPVFCAGDMAWGGTVVEAIGSGNEVAAEVDAFLRKVPYQHKKAATEVVQPEDINLTYYLPIAKHHEKLHHPRDFYGDFKEVLKALKAEEIKAEAARCLHCGECFDCGNCFNFCPDAAIHVDESGRLRIDYDYCKGCGICVAECPCSAIEFNLTETAL